ncbi:MAG TPA: rRNA maturation RNase YbeY [Ilumatobacter sp.]
MGEPGSPTGVEPHPVVSVVVGDEQAEVVIDADRWGRLAGDVLRAEGRSGELTVTFVDRLEIAALNAEHMGEPGPTDVLSFPLDADPTNSGPAVGPLLLGDVVICPAVAAQAAPDHAGTLDDELALLTVHGVLHVLGHDHADPGEAQVMRRRELELLEQLHWNGPAPAGFVQVQPS